MMTPEELRVHAIALANGDVGNAHRILDFIRPSAEAAGAGFVGSVAAAFPPASEAERPFKDREQDWRWSNVRCYAVIRAKDGAVVYVDRRENDLSMKGSGNGLVWPVSHGPGPFNVYVFDRDTGRSGYVGSADGWSFVDDNIAPDTTRPMPLPVPSLDSYGEEPSRGEWTAPAALDGEKLETWLERLVLSLQAHVNGVPH